MAKSKKKKKAKKKNPGRAVATTAPSAVGARSHHDPDAAGRLVMLLAVTALLEFPNESPERSVGRVANDVREAIGAEGRAASDRAGRDPFAQEQVAFAVTEMLSVLEIAEPLAVAELQSLRRTQNPSTPEGQAALYAWVGSLVGMAGGSLIGSLVGAAAAAGGAVGAGVALTGLGVLVGGAVGARYAVARASKIPVGELRETKNYATFGALLMPWFGTGAALGGYLGPSPNPRFDEGAEPFHVVHRLSPSELDALGYRRHGGLPMVFAQMRTGQDFATVLREMQLGPPTGLSDEVDAGRLEAYVLARHQPKRNNWSYATIVTYDPAADRFTEMAGPRNRPPQQDDRALFFSVLMEGLRHGPKASDSAARTALLTTDWPRELVAVWGKTGITAGAMADSVIDTAHAAGWTDDEIAADPRGAMREANEIWESQPIETGWADPEYVEGYDENPRKWNPQLVTVQVAMRGGQSRDVPAVQVTPHLVVHPSVRTGEEVELAVQGRPSSWGITHGPTGALVATLADEKWAKQLAQEIEKSSGPGIGTLDVMQAQRVIGGPDMRRAQYIGHISRQSGETKKSRGKFPSFRKWSETAHELDENPAPNPEDLKEKAAIAAAVGSIVGLVGGSVLGAVVLGGVGLLGGSGGAMAGAVLGIPLGGFVGSVWGAVRQTGEALGERPGTRQAKVGAGVGTAFFGPVIGSGVGAYMGAPG